MKIAILDDYQDVALGYADWKGLPGSPEVTVFTEHIERHELLADELRPFDVIVAMRERTAFPASLLALLPGLKLLVTTGMGNAAIDLDAARERGVTVCGTGGYPGSTAELTWGLILSVVRHIPAEDQRMRASTRAGGAAVASRGGWQQTIGTSLHGKTLGVVGLGRIGREVAAVGQAFGMQVAAWSQNLDEDEARNNGVRPVSKEQLFSGSDVVTIHYKLSPRSTGLVGAAELRLMKPTAYLVNTSRGPIVDGPALVAALRGGQIAGAALDVYDTEPLPLGDSLRTLPNTVLTPHLGYVTDDTYRVFYREAAEDVAAFASGSPLRVLNG
ncbi:MAG TPA: D-2-hydroxyacid dehydrogenase family protein [Streptosporangiaceae bacterium]|jgi:phosphoglycerate dehydrogenase-like enzyme|nr:D-2-hydroxyacid dehydrogenase family protein [Streptosporangiaceae bacterium]